MDQMALDEVLEVPDTPDALANQNITAQSGLEKQNSSFRSGHFGKGPLFPDESKNCVRSSDKAQIHPPKSFNKSYRSGHHGNSMGFHSGDSSSSGNSRIFRRKVADKGLNYETRGPEHLSNKQNKKSLFASQSYAGQDNAVIDLTERKQHAPELIKAFPSGAPGVIQAELADSTSSYGRANSSLILKEANEGRHLPNANKVDSSFDYIQRVVNNNDAQLNSRKSESVILNSSLIPRATRQKRLVRNGCISPNNIAKGKQPVEKDNRSSTCTRESGSVPVASNASTSWIDVRDIVAEDHNSHSRKGKGVLNNPYLMNMTNTHKSFRNSLSINENTGESGCTSNGGVPHFVESTGWRTTHTQSRKLNPPVSRQGQHVSIEDGGPCSSSQGNGNKVMRIEKEDNATTVHKNSNGQMLDASAPFGKTKGCYMAKSSVAKRQKHDSVSSSNAECSRSASDDSGIMFFGSSGQTTRAISTEDKNRNSAGITESVIHIDEAATEVQHVRSPGRSGSNADATATQVELDEILARELQEQFYNEDPAVVSGEIDAHVALALQREEGSQHTVSRRRRPDSNPASSGRSSLNRPRVGARAPSSNRMARLRNRFPGQPRTISSSRGRNSTILSARQRNSLFPADMDVDMRMHILEALESFSDMGVGSSSLQMQRDFNENDYEMLLALDENNHQHAGATTRQINGLPQSTVQNATLEEACAICLENPTMGDIIRHLPCLHKFHKDCIDPWLTRRTSCPVCKSSIT